MSQKVLQPDGWPRPSGYANGIAASGTMVFVSGMIGWDQHQQLVSDDFVLQARQALQNIVDVLASGGAEPAHVVRLTWYVTDKAEYLAQRKALGAVYREIFGRHFPAMTAVQVAALMEDGAKVEIEATAVIPSRNV
ncbi:RidA family protein [Undibacterium squillarum]|uniref:Enamine deaminase RidA n=1 Tax=Undibacterium squillarum TaxID=1131567 RepID=A0ABQ2XS89_9BURK|nr:RidA family protein [Undibacterium squillarum]GGX29554.1 enamine deaminase RidA [Undibacterium squillarum]